MEDTWFSEMKKKTKKEKDAGCKFSPNFFWYKHPFVLASKRDTTA